MPPTQEELKMQNFGLTEAQFNNKTNSQLAEHIFDYYKKGRISFNFLTRRGASHEDIQDALADALVKVVRRKNPYEYDNTVALFKIIVVNAYEDRRRIGTEELADTVIVAIPPELGECTFNDLLEMWRTFNNVEKSGVWNYFWKITKFTKQKIYEFSELDNRLETVVNVEHPKLELLYQKITRKYLWENKTQRMVEQMLNLQEGQVNTACSAFKRKFIHHIDNLI